MRDLCTLRPFRLCASHDTGKSEMNAEAQAGKQAQPEPHALRALQAEDHDVLREIYLEAVQHADPAVYSPAQCLAWSHWADQLQGSLLRGQGLVSCGKDGHAEAFGLRDPADQRLPHGRLCRSSPAPGPVAGCPGVDRPSGSRPGIAPVNTPLDPRAAPLRDKSPAGHRDPLLARPAGHAVRVGPACRPALLHSSPICPCHGSHTV